MESWTRGRTAELVGDAVLLTAVAIVAAPLALVVGPAAAWLLHRRPVDKTSVISGVIGLVLGVAIAAAIGAAVFAVSAQTGTLGSDEFAGGIVVFTVVAVVFCAIALALVVDAVRDLLSKQRRHPTTDIVRLVVVGLLFVAGVAVALVQQAKPETEIGTAAVFAVVVGLVGGVVALMWTLVYRRMERQSIADAVSS